MIKIHGTGGGASATKNQFKVSIDRESNEMLIESKQGFLNFERSQMKYDLSGWTSRYGKPIELSIALHLSTMAPDFVLDFCDDPKLQTSVNIRANKVDYSLEYKFKANGSSIPVTKKEIMDTYDKIKEREDDIDNLNQLFYSGTKLAEKYMNTSGGKFKNDIALPIDILYKTNIIKIWYVKPKLIDGKTIDRDVDDNEINFDGGSSDNKYYYYKCVDKDGNPVSFSEDIKKCIDKDGNPDNIKYIVHNVYKDSNDSGSSKENKELYFEKTNMSDDEMKKENEDGDSDYVIKVTDLYKNRITDSGSKKEDQETRKFTGIELKVTNDECIILYLQTMSFNDLLIYFEETKDKNPITTWKEFDLKSSNISQGAAWDNKIFACSDEYFESLKALDMYINETIIGHKDSFKKSQISMNVTFNNLQWDEDNKKIIKSDLNFNTDDDEKDYTLYESAEVFSKIVDASRDSSDDYKVKIETFCGYMEDFIKYVNEDIAKILENDKYELKRVSPFRSKVVIALTDEIQSDLEKWGLSGDNFFLLYDVFEGLADNIVVYRPYIASVRNHWYKDLVFEGDVIDQRKIH